MEKRATPEAQAALFLRLEGPLQAWGSRAIGRVRRTESIPTKSGVMGLLGAAMGCTRAQMNQTVSHWNKLLMAVRVDREGRIEEDYQTVGAGIGILAADGSIKRTASSGEVETIISPREFLVDASFLVVLLGQSERLRELAEALKAPRWPLFLGRKRCVPARPLFAGFTESITLAQSLHYNEPEAASELPADQTTHVRVVMDCIDQAAFQHLLGAPASDTDVQEQYIRAQSSMNDLLLRLEPPRHAPRRVLDFTIPRPVFDAALPDEAPPQKRSLAPKKAAREKAANRCIFCRFETAPRSLHAHHLTYARRGNERVSTDDAEIGNDDFVMLCAECHAAVTMLEYQFGFGNMRIDPRQPLWRSRIFAAREMRRRHANPAHPAFAPLAIPPSGIGAHSAYLVHSVIPLRAGSQFKDDAPGNRWLANRQFVHQRLTMAFPQIGNELAAEGYGVQRSEGGFLFRIEPGPRARIIVQSRILPDWGRAFRHCTWLVESPFPAPRFVAIADIRPETAHRFVLHASPGKRLAKNSSQGQKGARVPLTTDDELLDWLNRQAQRNGFQLQPGSLQVTRLGNALGKPRASALRVWQTICFTGTLNITDQERFRRALTAGIGPAKAFGFGLLSIAPVP